MSLNDTACAIQISEYFTNDNSYMACRVSKWDLTGKRKRDVNGTLEWIGLSNENMEPSQSQM